MNKETQIKPHLLIKRRELIWALSKQGYTSGEIASIFGLSRSRAHAISSTVPEGWVSPWVKVRK